MGRVGQDEIGLQDRHKFLVVEDLIPILKAGAQFRVEVAGEIRLQLLVLTTGQEDVVRTQRHEQDRLLRRQDLPFVQRRVPQVPTWRPSISIQSSFQQHYLNN